MVEGVDQQSYKLRYINLHVPGGFFQFFLPVCQVCGEYSVQHTPLIQIMKLIQSLCEKGEGDTHIDVCSLSLLQFLYYIQNGVSGG